MRQRQSPSGPLVNLASYPAEVENDPVAGAVVIDWSKGAFQVLYLATDATVVMAGLPAGETAEVFLSVVQRAGGNHTPTFPNSLTPGGTPLSFSTANGADDIVRVFWNGSQLFLSFVGKDFK